MDAKLNIGHVGRYRTQTRINPSMGLRRVIPDAEGLLIDICQMTTAEASLRTSTEL